MELNLVEFDENGLQKLFNDDSIWSLGCGTINLTLLGIAEAFWVLLDLKKNKLMEYRGLKFTSVMTVLMSLMKLS